MILLNPAVHVALGLLPFVALIIYLGILFDRGEEYETYRDQIVIAESHIAFGETKDGGTVVVLGTVANKSAVPWQDVIFQIEFLDEAGKIIDTVQRSQYPMRLPATNALPFKVSARREFPQSEYKKHVVRVVSAKDARARW